MKNIYIIVVVFAVVFTGCQAPESQQSIHLRFNCPKGVRFEKWWFDSKSKRWCSDNSPVMYDRNGDGKIDMYFSGPFSGLLYKYTDIDFDGVMDTNEKWVWSGDWGAPPYKSDRLSTESGVHFDCPEQSVEGLRFLIEHPHEPRMEKHFPGG